MHDLYTMLIKAKDGNVVTLAHNVDGEIHVAIAVKDGVANVFLETLPEALKALKGDDAKIIALVRDVLSSPNVHVYIRPMIGVKLIGGVYEIGLLDNVNKLDPAHPDLAARLVVNKTRNSSMSGGRVNTKAKLFGKYK